MPCIGCMVPAHLMANLEKPRDVASTTNVGACGATERACVPSSSRMCLRHPTQARSTTRTRLRERVPVARAAGTRPQRTWVTLLGLRPCTAPPLAPGLRPAATTLPARKRVSRAHRVGSKPTHAWGSFVCVGGTLVTARHHSPRGQRRRRAVRHAATGARPSTPPGPPWRRPRTPFPAVPSTHTSCARGPLATTGAVCG